MDLENIRGYYKDKIKAHGTGAEGMDWQNISTLKTIHQFLM